MFTLWFALVAWGMRWFFFLLGVDGNSTVQIGYFVLNHTRMGPATDLFGQLWKEYSMSDSRYLTSDPFVLCMETITAVFASARDGLKHRDFVH